MKSNQSADSCKSVCFIGKISRASTLTEHALSARHHETGAGPVAMKLDISSVHLFAMVLIYFFKFTTTAPYRRIVHSQTQVAVQTYPVRIKPTEKPIYEDNKQNSTTNYTAVTEYHRKKGYNWGPIRIIIITTFGVVFFIFFIAVVVLRIYASLKKKWLKKEAERKSISRKSSSIGSTSGKNSTVTLSDTANKISKSSSNEIEHTPLLSDRSSNDPRFPEHERITNSNRVLIKWDTAPLPIRQDSLKVPPHPSLRKISSHGAADKSYERTVTVSKLRQSISGPPCPRYRPVPGTGLSRRRSYVFVRRDTLKLQNEPQKGSSSRKVLKRQSRCETEDSNKEKTSTKNRKACECKVCERYRRVVYKPTAASISALKSPYSLYPIQSPANYCLQPLELEAVLMSASTQYPHRERHVGAAYTILLMVADKNLIRRLAKDNCTAL